MQVLQMGYAGGGLSMWIALPEDRPGALAKFETTLDVERLQRWMRVAESQEVQVSLPRFRFESKFSELRALEELGIRRVFASGQAELGGITKEKPLYLGEIWQKALVEVDEEGTVAAAVTGGCFGGMAEPKRNAIQIFRADRPFLFFVRDDRTGAILFLGRCNEPADATPVAVSAPF